MDGGWVRILASRSSYGCGKEKFRGWYNQFTALVTSVLLIQMEYFQNEKY